MASRQPIVGPALRRAINAAAAAAGVADAAQQTADGAVIDASDAQGTADEALELASLAFEGATLKGGILTTSASAGAITISIKTAAGNTPSVGDEVTVIFSDQSSTITEIVVNAAKTITIPSGATLGLPSSQGVRVWVVAMLNDGATDFELAVVNRVLWLTGSITAKMIPDRYLYGNQLGISVIGTGSDSYGNIYTSTSIASASRPMRILGSLLYESGITPGTWVNPSAIILAGRGVKGPGDVVQSGTLSRNIGSTVNLTVALPIDNTRPDFSSGEFGFWQSIDITPESASDFIEVEFDGYVAAPTGATTADYVAMGVGIANSDWNAMGFAKSLGANIPQQIHMKSALPFPVGGLFQNNLQFGPACTTTGNFFINRMSGSELFGGACWATIKVSEIVG